MMRIEVDEEDQIVTINGQKFTFAFFEHLIEPDGRWLYRLERAGETVTVTKVMRLSKEMQEQLDSVH